jgi:hypothetical protein
VFINLSSISVKYVFLLLYCVLISLPDLKVESKNDAVVCNVHQILKVKEIDFVRNSWAEKLAKFKIIIFSNHRDLQFYQQIAASRLINLIKLTIV